jgi:hypothetical protein
VYGGLDELHAPNIPRPSWSNTLQTKPRVAFANPATTAGTSREPRPPLRSDGLVFQFLIPILSICGDRTSSSVHAQ